MPRHAAAKFAIVAALLLRLPGPAGAAEVAELQPIGFSVDGRYFAFEQYGIADGSGFPYSEVFVIDVDANAWLPGTPIRIRPQAEGPIEPIRVAARQQAAPLFERAGILGESPGRHLLSHPLTDRGVAADTARFALLPYANPEYRLDLEQRDVAAPDCPDLFGPIRLFTLRLAAPDWSARELQQDERLYASRGCP
jgi:hypothetical protein